MKPVARRLLYIGLAILLTLLVGTTGFIVIEDYDLLDAFYMSLITMTTVGYGEIRPLSPQGRIFNLFLIFFGVTTMFFAIGAMTQTIIELELMEFFGKRRIKRMIDKLENHYIVCGFGRVGRGAAGELQRAGATFVVVDINPERVERAILAGMLAVAADSTRDHAGHVSAPRSPPPRTVPKSATPAGNSRPTTPQPSSAECRPASPSSTLPAADALSRSTVACPSSPQKCLQCDISKVDAM